MTMNHHVTGSPDAPALVLSNSLGTSTAMWKPQIEALAARHRVVAYDHRGHGGSPPLPGPYTFEDLGSDVIDLLDQLEIERASLCGVSLGAMVGMWLGANRPDRIDRLVLACTSAYLPPAEAWAERAAAVRAAGSTEVVADAVLSRWMTQAGLDESPERTAALREMLLGTSAEGYAGCCGAIETLDLRPELGRIGAPTLVIAGADDPATPPEHLQVIADGIPAATLRIIDGGAHLANIEQAAIFNDLVLRHLGGGDIPNA